ncbi:MAG: Dickkopf N-terminal cysteine-rich domain-containing protein [Myxococcota bacterium]
MHRTLVWVGVLLMVGCSLGYDTTETPFRAQGDLLGGDTSIAVDVGMSDDPEADTTPSARDTSSDASPNVRVGLGELCGASTAIGDDCIPGSDRWPACTDRPCDVLGDTGRCIRGYSLYGACSVSCQTDADCVGDPEDPFKASMRCVRSMCRPGSQQACTDDSVCGAGEVCKLVLDDDGSWVSVCQTATRGGVGRGELCNDDPSLGPVVLCANDLCLDDVCAGLCPENGQPPSPDYCMEGNLMCQSDGAETFLRPSRLAGALPTVGLCAPKPCSGPDMCDPSEGEPLYCTVRAQRSDTGGLEGVCRRDNPRQDGSLALGEACGGFGDPPDLSLCASRSCVGIPPNYFCAALCDRDSDCGDSQLCLVERLSVDDTLLFVNICSYARGSRTNCIDDNDCVGGEVCAPFTLGSVEPSGTEIREGRQVGLCIVPVPSGVPPGSACEEQGCLAPGTCFRSDNGVRLCGEMCDLNDPFACAFDELCRPVTVVSDEEHLDGNALVLGRCVAF